MNCCCQQLVHVDYELQSQGDTCRLTLRQTTFVYAALCMGMACGAELEPGG